MRNQMYPHWDRSSAFTPEQIGALNVATGKAVKGAIQTVIRELGDANLTEEQRAEMIEMIARGVSDGVMAFSESLKR